MKKTVTLTKEELNELIKSKNEILISGEYKILAEMLKELNKMDVRVFRSQDKKIIGMIQEQLEIIVLIYQDVQKNIRD